jgi:hypothetical protein
MRSLWRWWRDVGETPDCVVYDLVGNSAAIARYMRALKGRAK